MSCRHICETAPQPAPCEGWLDKSEKRGMNAPALGRSGKLSNTGFELFGA